LARLPVVATFDTGNETVRFDRLGPISSAAIAALHKKYLLITPREKDQKFTWQNDGASVERDFCQSIGQRRKRQIFRRCGKIAPINYVY
jgi:hypothetical protein